MYCVYVLKSTIHGKLYIGMSENPEKRLKEHNAGKTKSTKPFIPYTLIHTEAFQYKTDALKRERFMKNSGRIRKELKEGKYKASSSNG